MRIIHLVDYFQPKLGYQETFLAREHAKLGHKVWVVTSDRYYPFSNYMTAFYKLLGKRLVGSGTRIEEGVKTIRLKSFEIPATPLIYLLDLKKTLKNIKPDVIYCHNMFSITSGRVAYLKSQIGYKLIYDTHAASFNTNLTNSLPKKIYHFLYQRLAVPKIKKESDAIFAIGEEEQKFICQEFNIDKKNVPIIRLGVDIERFVFARKKRDTVRKKLNLSEDDILIVFAGKIFPYKDLHILFRAVKILDDRRIKLLIIGDGDRKYIKRLREMLPEKNTLIWIPFLLNRELPSYFSGADIGIWPGNPSITMLEAMSCGLPLILSRSVGTEYLDESRAVLWFKRNRSEVLSEQIKKLSYNISTRRKMRSYVRSYIERKLSWETIAKQTLEII